jgi:hypothetical protein
MENVSLSEEAKIVWRYRTKDGMLESFAEFIKGDHE